MTKQVFYDPHRKRWKRLRLLFDLLALAGLIIGAIFVIGVVRIKPLPELMLTEQKRNYRTIAANQNAKLKNQKRSAHRRTDISPADVTLNAGEGLRAAYYVEDDPASFSSFRDHVSQIDLLFPEWLHVVTPDGSLTGYTIDYRAFPVITKSGVQPVDREAKVARTIAENHVNLDIFPLVNNYNTPKGVFQPEVGEFLSNPDARANFIRQVDKFLAANSTYRGLSLDFEEIPDTAQAGFQNLVAELYADFHARSLRLYVNAPVDNDSYDLKFLADHSDGLLIMNYDQHQTESEPGPIASQDWFIDNLKEVLKTVPKEKVICSIGSYGYNWTTTLPQAARKGQQPPPVKVLSTDQLSTQEAWQDAYDSGSDIDLDDDSLNVHFQYDDEDAGVHHEVWFLDAVTVLNQMRAARALGIETYALWRLGQEDNSLWKIWDKPLHADPANDLAHVEPGYDVDTEGEGDILRITRRPQDGVRDITLDDDDSVPLQYRMITQEIMRSYPLSYTVGQYGYHQKKVALSFDDGPDPEWTPRILDILKRYNVKGTFFMVGENAEKYPGIMQRVYREGHEIGNHTFTHP
ncbi:MAG: polysaccharide deacetylase family protein, partial [Acidobacteriaceae bacterium]|nr:polysaccharide deacetylase family protein [Acidobacteriaceae bacterium]